MIPDDMVDWLKKVLGHNKIRFRGRIYRCNHLVRVANGETEMTEDLQEQTYQP